MLDVFGPEGEGWDVGDSEPDLLEAVPARRHAGSHSGWSGVEDMAGMPKERQWGVSGYLLNWSVEAD